MHHIDFGLGILDFGFEEKLSGPVKRLFSGNPKSAIQNPK